MRFERKYMPELFASKDETRTHLCHVEYDPEAKCLVATDGHRLIRVPCWPEAGEDAGAVSAEALKAARKIAKSAKRDDARVHANGALVTGGAEDGGAGPTFPRPQRGEDCKFPPYRQVIPDYSKGDSDVPVRSFAVNAVYLAEAAKALGAEIITITIRGELEPILVRDNAGASDPTALAVVMPCRI